MSLAGAQEDITLEAPRISVAEPRDYFALLKPRVMSLVVFSAVAGLLTARGPINPVVAVVSLLAIAVGAGAAGALNMWYDADIDAIMTRTRLRPVPNGKITPEEALGFGLTLAGFSVMTLGLAANWLSAALLAFTIFFYVVIYTMWLKRWTPQNIVIGGAAGALPPVVAHAAIAGSVSLTSLALFALIFMWTPPHFWALALVKSGDYARAGVPMMPNVKGAARTRLEILIYSLLLAPTGLLPYFAGGATKAYAAVAGVGGCAMIWAAVQLYRCGDGPGAHKIAMRLFGLSILYLFALLGAIVVERCFAIWGL